MNILAKSGTSARPFHFFKENYIMDKKVEEIEYRPLNKGMPAFVGKTEITRLRKVIEEKNLCISKFKEYDEQRKAYYAELEAANVRHTAEKAELVKQLKEAQKALAKEREANKEPFFAEELRSLVENGDMTSTEYEKFMKLYAYWLKYRNDVMFYKSRMKTGRGSIKDLKKDLKEISKTLMKAGDMELLDALSARMLLMTAHLDTLQQRLSSAADDDEENPEKGIEE